MCYRWLRLLQQARHGNCNADNLKHLLSLILSNPNCPLIDFGQDPWKDIILVTPRYAVQNQWNKAAIQQHCVQTGCCLFVCHVEGTIRDWNLTLQEQYQVLTKKSRGSGNGCTKKGISSLPCMAQVAIGMKVMFTYNIKMELDIANGA